jgi:hypothetical protein
MILILFTTLLSNCIQYTVASDVDACSKRYPNGCFVVGCEFVVWVWWIVGGRGNGNVCRYGLFNGFMFVGVN